MVPEQKAQALNFLCGKFFPFPIDKVELETALNPMGFELI